MEKSLSIAASSERSAGLHSVFRWLYTMLVVLFGWVLFRSESLRLSLQYFRAMFGLSPRGFVPYSVFYFLNRRTMTALCVSALLSFSTGLFHRWKRHDLQNPAVGELLRNLGYLLLLSLSIIFLVSGSYNAFIYFQF